MSAPLSLESAARSRLTHSLGLSKKNVFHNYSVPLSEMASETKEMISTDIVTDVQERFCASGIARGFFHVLQFRSKPSRLVFGHSVRQVKVHERAVSTRSCLAAAHVSSLNSGESAGNRSLIIN